MLCDVRGFWLAGERTFPKGAPKRYLGQICKVLYSNTKAKYLNLVFEVFFYAEVFGIGDLFFDSVAVRWNSVEIEFQNPSLEGRPRPSASLIISVNLLIKMSCKRFPSFHSDHYQHARPARWIPQLFSPFHTAQSQTMHAPNAHRLGKGSQSFCSREHGIFRICLNSTLVDVGIKTMMFWYLRKLPYGLMFCPSRFRGQMRVFFTLRYRQQRRDGINRVVGPGHKSGHGQGIQAL